MTNTTNPRLTTHNGRQDITSGVESVVLTRGNCKEITFKFNLSNNNLEITLPQTMGFKNGMK